MVRIGGEPEFAPPDMNRRPMRWTDPEGTKRALAFSARRSSGLAPVTGFRPQDPELLPWDRVPSGRDSWRMGSALSAICGRLDDEPTLTAI